MSNYSFGTSLPAYAGNQEDKKRQSEKILEAIRCGGNNICKISEMTGLESGRVSARVSDLVKNGSIHYDNMVTYKDRKRKRIVVSIPIISHNVTTQPLIF